MDVGNKTHAAILGIAAIGAIGWMGMRMIPRHPGIAPNDHVGPTLPAVAASGLPQDVTRDAFSHPALYHPSKNASSGAQGGGAMKGSLALAGDVAEEPVAGDVRAENGGSRPIQVVLSPGEIAVKGQQPDKKTTVRFCLKAVVQATKPLAMILITSDTNPSVQTYSIGQMVAGGYTLTSIGSSGVVLTAKKRRPIDLEVGGQEVETK